MSKPHIAESKLACKQRFFKLKVNKSYNSIRKSWWESAPRNQPLFAQNVSNLAPPFGIVNFSGKLIQDLLLFEGFGIMSSSRVKIQQFPNFLP